MTIETYKATKTEIERKYQAGLLTYKAALEADMKLRADYLKGKTSCLLPV